MLNQEEIKNKIIRKIKVCLALRGKIVIEGCTSSEELAYLAGLVSNGNIKLVGEVGFNAGFSSYIFLDTNPDIKVVSFDLVKYSYVKSAKKMIDKKFPGRHILIYGDSKQTLPKFAEENPDIYFDLVFIDGGHDYKTAKSDIINLRRLSTKDTIVIIDDLTPWLHWGKGPTKAWSEAIQEGLIVQKNSIKMEGLLVVSNHQGSGAGLWDITHFRPGGFFIL